MDKCGCPWQTPDFEVAPFPPAPEIKPLPDGEEVEEDSYPDVPESTLDIESDEFS